MRRPLGGLPLALALGCVLVGCARSKPKQEPARTHQRTVAAAKQRPETERVSPKLAQVGHDPHWSPDPEDTAYEPLVGWPNPKPWPGPGTAPVVSTWAGSVIGGPGGNTRETMLFFGIYAMTFDAAGNLYVADGPRIQVIAPNGAVGEFKHATLEAVSFVPTSMAFDHQGNLYATDYQAGLFKFAPNGEASVVAAGKFGAQALHQPQQFERAWGLAVDAADNVYVSDQEANVIKRITPAGDVSTFARGFDEPEGLAFDGGGNLLVADHRANCIQRVSPSGQVTTLIRLLKGNILPAELAWHPSGAIYFSAQQLYRLDPDGTCTVLSPANQGTTGYIGHDLGHTRFLNAGEIAVDRAGDLYVSDFGSNTNGSPCGIRKVAFQAGSWPR
ncbi:MAG: repeat containing protein [Cyanobacteria bacterium RYN_339]|nr:repeat containing protein [Cyanobacteria bacterium RYN_339]